MNERGTLLGIRANVCWWCASIAFIDGEIRGTPTKAGRHVRHTAILEDLPRQVEAMRDEAQAGVKVFGRVDHIEVTIYYSDHVFESCVAE